MSGLSVKSFYNKSNPYTPPHLRKKNHVSVECKIVDFDISDAEEKDEEKFNEIQDIKSQLQEHEEVGSPDEQESEDDKTLDEHSVGEEWSESSESVDLSDGSDVKISRNKRCTKEDSNKKLKEKIFWHKSEPPIVDSTFHVKAFPDPPLTETSPYIYFRKIFDDELIKHISDQTNLYSVHCTGKSLNENEGENKIEQYFGILLLMSVIKLPQVRMYWSEGTRIPGIADMMSINRFEKIRQYFHCNDNSVCSSKSDKNYDKSFRVPPVIDSVLDKCKSVPQEEMQSVDEQIIFIESCCGIK